MQEVLHIHADWVAGTVNFSTVLVARQRMFESVPNQLFT